MYGTLFLSRAFFDVPKEAKKERESVEPKPTKTAAHFVCTTSVIIQETRSFIYTFFSLFKSKNRLNHTRTGTLLTAQLMYATKYWFFCEIGSGDVRGGNKQCAKRPK
jgi:hypothetical protein